jgi:c(7)-type cytochrome triheme protein
MDRKIKPKKIKKISALGVIVSLGVAVAVAVSAGNDEETVSDMDQSLPEWGTSKAVSMKPLDVMFSHTSHVVTHGISCAECHTGMFAMEYGAAAATGDYNMAALEERRFCGACHNDDSAFGVVEENTCKKCHGSDMTEPEIIVFTKPVKAVLFDHQAHTDDFGLACIDCHSQLFRAKTGYAEQRPEDFVMESLYQGRYCGACHDGIQAFASNTRCTDCHIGVRGYDKLFDEGDKEK